MFAIFQGDKAVIAVAFSPEVVGWYGAAFMLSMAPAMLVTSVLQSLLLPILSRCQNVPDEFRLRYLEVVQSCLAVGLLTAATFAIFGPELLVMFFGSRYHVGAEVVIVLGLTQGVRIAKSGQFVSSVALGRTKDPLISNLARGTALLVAIGLVVNGYDPVAVALTGLLGEVISYAIAMQLLANKVRYPVIHQMPQLIVWLVLAILSWVIGNGLRGSEVSFSQLFLSIFWVLVTTAFFVAISPIIRGRLIQLFKRNKVGE
jgi:O-antigen/teichoic acid export membrane protein